jgi:hypothetical protein
MSTTQNHPLDSVKTRREQEISIELGEEDGAARREQNQLGGFTSYSE